MIYFTGDICLCDKAFDIGFGVGSKIAQGIVKPFYHLKKLANEIWVGNFEGVVSDTSNIDDYSHNSFRIQSDTFDKCDSIIDYWGIANNHVMEHGDKAYLQMESILNDKSKGAFGSQRNKSICFEHQRKKVAITGFCMRAEDSNNEPLYWYTPELHDLKEEYEKIADADYKVAYIHWGVEYVDHPSMNQVKLAHWLIDIGYSLVIGMHSHVLQGYETYKGKYIFYSLGNFVFSMPYEPTIYGAIVTLDVESGLVGYHYTRIGKDWSPELITEDQVPSNFRLEILNEKIGKEENIEIYISKFYRGLKAYRKSNNKEIISNIFKFKSSIFFQIIINFIKRRLQNAY